MTLLIWFALFADSHTLVQEANALFRAEKYTEARKKYEEALVDAPESPIIEYNLGTVYLAENDFDKAKHHFQNALQTRDPELETEIKFNLGHASFNKAKTGLKDISDPEKVKRTVTMFRDAIRYWRDVLKLKPDHADAKQNIVVATNLLKDYLDRVKRFREEQKKKQDQQKGKSLAELLKDLIKRQLEDEQRTRSIITLQNEIKPYQAQQQSVEAVGKTVEAAVEAMEQASTGTEPQANVDGITGQIAQLIQDPDLVEGASDLQKAEKALAASPPDLQSASKLVGNALNDISKQVSTRTEKAKAEHKTDVTNQEKINTDTQGVIMDIEQTMSAGTQGAPPAPPGAQQQQGLPLSPEQKELFKKVQDTVREAAQFQTEALSKLKAQVIQGDPFAEAADNQKNAADKLKEALEMLPKQQPKQDQKNDQKKQDQDQQDKQQKQQKQQKKQQQQKQLSRKQAEDILRNIREKERKKKQEKNKLRARAMGKRNVKKDW